MEPVFAYIISLIAVIVTAVSGSMFTNKNVKSAWYKCIRSKITPPSYVFPIVWTTLYVLLTFAFARTLLLPSRTIEQQIIKRYIVFMFVLHMLLQILWTYLFFAKKYVAVASIVITFLVAITALIMMGIWQATNDRVFPGNSKTIVWLLVPMLMWISFATVLNFLSVGKVC